MRRSYYYATPLPEPGKQHTGKYTLQCFCEAEGKPTLAAGIHHVDGCSWEPARQCAVFGQQTGGCPPGYAQGGKCVDTNSSWPDNLYSTNIPHQPGYYRWNTYLGFVGYPAGAKRNIYENGRHWPASSEGKPCIGFGC